jgi:hypothetical protein
LVGLPQDAENSYANGARLSNRAGELQRWENRPNQ